MDSTTVKSAVKEKYAALASAAAPCCGPSSGCGTQTGLAGNIVMNDLYSAEDPAIRESADLGLGCGTPAAFADLQPGMIVLDLGSGAGIDVFVASRYVGTSGRVIGVDMTQEMIDRAESNQRKLHIDNVEFRLGEIESLPVDDSSIDRILSNCVINLVPDKRAAFSEMFRVLRPGGRFTVSDIVAIGQIPEDIRNDMLEWAGCVAGALDKEEYLAIVREAGFADLQVSAERPYQLDASLPFGLRSITLSATRPE